MNTNASNCDKCPVLIVAAGVSDALRLNETTVPGAYILIVAPEPDDESALREFFGSNCERCCPTDYCHSEIEAIVHAVARRVRPTLVIALADARNKARRILFEAARRKLASSGCSLLAFADAPRRRCNVGIARARVAPTV